MQGNYTKSQRKLIREWCGIAYERSLSAELAKLKMQFTKWENQDIDAFQLEEAVHRFHNGVARELYNQHDEQFADLAVTGAIRTGILKLEELPEELKAALARLIEFAMRPDEKAKA